MQSSVISKQTAIRVRINIILILLFTLMLMIGDARAKTDQLPQEQSQTAKEKLSSSLIFVIHVDVMPPFAVPATELLTKYKRTSFKDPGVKRVEILQQVGRPNHFTIIEEWDNQAAYDAHLGTLSTREFRSNLQPMLGSPFDERAHHALD